MSFFSELEENLEKYIDKLFFKNKPGEQLQPVDIARQMAREMRRKRRTGLTGVFVPNRYQIAMGPKDYQVLEPLLERLAGELKDFITEKAAEKKYELAGPVAIDFITEPELVAPAERLLVEGRFEQQPAGETEAYPEQRREDTQQFVPIRYSQPKENTFLRESRAVLEQISGARGGAQYELDAEFTVIGRRENCDICLKDAGISRKHAVITRSGGRFVIIDQDSSNGTYINGSRINSQVLKTGDVIVMGSTALTFKVV